MKLSVTIISLAVLIISSVLKSAGIEFVEADIETAIYVIAQVASAIGIWYGRYRAGDITWYGVKK